MFCSSCGKTVAEGAAFCPQCGRSVAAGVAPTPAFSSSPNAPAAYIPSAPVAVVAPGLVYAGFWLRFVAYVIDMALLVFVEFAFILVLVLALGLGRLIRNWPENPNPDVFFAPAIIVGIVLFGIGMTVMIWLYYALMESSRYQGTLGKMALGLIVTDLQVQPVSFARASGRFFAKFITGLIPLFIGYIMAGFTAKKQALHDMIASCLVLRKI
jgi:uncharacterized RDD family membrane protein YckC